MTSGRPSRVLRPADCCRTVLDLDDVVALLRMARVRGVHCAMWQLTDDAGYTRPQIAPTKTPEQELAERMQRHAQEFARLADEHAAIVQAKSNAGRPNG